MYRKAVRVEIAPGDDNSVRVAASVRDIQRRHNKVADDAPPFTRVNQLPQVIGIFIFVLGDDEGTPNIDNVRVVDKGPVGISVPRAHLARRKTGTLDRNTGTVGIDARSTGRGSNIRIAGRIDDHLCKYHAASLGRGDYNTFDTPIFHECTAAQRAEPEVSTGPAQLAPIPFLLVLDIPSPIFMLGTSSETGNTIVNLFGEAFNITVIIFADKAERSHSTETVEVLHHESLRPLPCRGNAGRRPTGAAANDNYVHLTEHRYSPSVNRNGHVLGLKRA